MPLKGPGNPASISIIRPYSSVIPGLTRDPEGRGAGSTAS